jgi:hypothetical protein
MKKSINAAVILLLISYCGCKEVTNVTPDSITKSESTQIPHLERKGSAARLVVDGKPLLLLAGELHNSTAGGLKTMRPVWKKLAAKHLNTVIATVSWELIEPEEGKFDFTLVDSTIAGAREANLKLVLIWFGSWKNGGSTYCPSWVKKDFEKYTRVKDENGMTLEILSPFNNITAEKDAAAYSALMRHIREKDSVYHTVVMMQVENEVGVLDNKGKLQTGTKGNLHGNARRDFSNPANIAYNGQVPAELTEYLARHKENLFPELYKIWSENGFRTTGSWEELFGKSKFKPDPKDWKFYSFYTEELFMAWNYARYIEKIAAAGKQEYPLPMYVNGWLKQPWDSWPGIYPSGGPLPQVIDIWRAAAPSIDFIAPDIYIDEFDWVCEEYVRSGNPLFIPETRGGAIAAARAFYAIGEYSAGLFAPFGIDNIRYAENDPLDESYAVLQRLAPVILEYQGTGLMRGILADVRAPVHHFALGGYDLEAKLDINDNNTLAGGLIIQTGVDEFIIAGEGFDLFFVQQSDSMGIALNTVDEGTFENGKWISERRLNGDEIHTSTYDYTGIRFPPGKVSIQKISLYRYK